MEEIGPGWLVQLICDDTEDEALHGRPMSGRQLLTDADEDEAMDTDDGYVEVTDDIWQWQAMRRKGRGSDSTCMRVADDMLRALRKKEFDEVRKAREADLAIQEQGIDFIRNLISIPDQPAQSDMVDYVFSELGQDRLFEILASKLRVKVLHPFARREASSSGTPAGGAGSSASGGRGSVNIESRVLYPQSKIIVAVIYLLTHIAAGIRHRQLVVSQPELLKLLAGHFSSKDVDVRRSLCHLLKNMAWCEGHDDREGRHQRVRALKDLGLFQKLESLEKDVELDIRERAKEAISTIREDEEVVPSFPHDDIGY